MSVNMYVYKARKQSQEKINLLKSVKSALQMPRGYFIIPSDEAHADGTLKDLVPYMTDVTLLQDDRLKKDAEQRLLKENNLSDDWRIERVVKGGEEYGVYFVNVIAAIFPDTDEIEDKYKHAMYEADVFEREYISNEQEPVTVIEMGEIHNWDYDRELCKKINEAYPGKIENGGMYLVNDRMADIMGLTPLKNEDEAYFYCEAY